jgi:hypothetical protein
MREAVQRAANETTDPNDTSCRPIRCTSRMLIIVGNCTRKAGTFSFRRPPQPDIVLNRLVGFGARRGRT